MTHASVLYQSPNDALFTIQEQPLDAAKQQYIRALAAQRSFSVHCIVDARHIVSELKNLLANDYFIQDYDMKFWQDIAEQIYPISAFHYAEGIALTISVSAQPLPPPLLPNDYGLYLAFDTNNVVELRCYLAPNHELPTRHAMSISAGMIVLCQPYDKNFYLLKDSRPFAFVASSSPWQRSERMFETTTGDGRVFADASFLPPIEHILISTTFLNSLQKNELLEVGSRTAPPTEPAAAELATASVALAAENEVASPIQAVETQQESASASAERREGIERRATVPVEPTESIILGEPLAFVEVPSAFISQEALTASAILPSALPASSIIVTEVFGAQLAPPTSEQFLAPSVQQSTPSETSPAPTATGAVVTPEGFIGPVSATNVFVAQPFAGVPPSAALAQGLVSSPAPVESFVATPSVAEAPLAQTSTVGSIEAIIPTQPMAPTAPVAQAPVQPATAESRSGGFTNTPEPQRAEEPSALTEHEEQSQRTAANESAPTQSTPSSERVEAPRDRPDVTRQEPQQLQTEERHLGEGIDNTGQRAQIDRAETRAESTADSGTANAALSASPDHSQPLDNRNISAVATHGQHEVLHVALHTISTEQLGTHAWNVAVYPHTQTIPVHVISQMAGSHLPSIPTQALASLHAHVDQVLPVHFLSQHTALTPDTYKILTQTPVSSLAVTVNPHIWNHATSVNAASRNPKDWVPHPATEGVNTLAKNYSSDQYRHTVQGENASNPAQPHRHRHITDMYSLNKTA